MSNDRIREILRQVERGELNADEAEQRIDELQSTGTGRERERRRKQKRRNEQTEDEPGPDIPGSEFTEEDSGLGRQLFDSLRDFIDKSVEWSDQQYDKAREKLEKERREVTVPLREDWKLLSLKAEVQAGKLQLTTADQDEALSGSFLSPVAKSDDQDAAFEKKVEQLPEGGGLIMLKQKAGSGDWTVTRKLPLRVDLDVDAGSAHLDLSDVDPARLDLECDAGSLVLQLSEKAAGTTVELDADASSVRLELPEDLGAVVNLTGSLSKHNLKEAGFTEQEGVWTRTGDSPDKLTITGETNLSMLRIAPLG